MSLSVRTNEVKRIVNHICVMTTVHKPDDVRISKEIETLKRLGVKITFLAPEGNCPILGIEYVSLPVFKNRLSRMLFSINKVFKLAATVNADIYHFHDPELIPVASKLKKIGKKIIYDVHENNPAAILNKEWLPKTIRKLISRRFARYEENASRLFDGIIVTTESVEKRFSGLSRVALLPNYRKATTFAVSNHYSIGSKPVVFVYAGAISSMTCVNEIIQAAYVLKKRKNNFALKIAGPISNKRLVQALREVHEPVEYLGVIPRKEAELLVKNSDVGLLLYSREDPNAVQCSPNKLFEYLSLGKPIIATDNDYWRIFLGQDSCVYVEDPSNPEEIAEKMEIMLDDRVREAKSKESAELGMIYTWESIESRLIDLYRQLLKA